LPLVLLLQASCTGLSGRCALWIDVFSGEPVAYEEMLDDLADARVIYVGERHVIQRHHDIQARIVTDLGERDIPLVLALEQMEAFNQPALDEYWQGDISFEELAEKTDWAKRWSNYADYRPILEAARRCDAPIVALNARSETIRAVGKQGIDGLDPETRSELPEEINLEDPAYEQHLNRVLMVHARVTPEMVRKVFEAQVARDESMAAHLSEFLQSEQGAGRTAVVVCGAGHVSYGLGTPDRVRRRMPDAEDRILVLSESGDVELSPKMKAMMRDITITHAQLREIGRPIADYLHAVESKPESESE
jgi:uncharacterized iron-regulated protein